MYMLRFDIVRCVVLLFYVLMKHIILYVVNIVMQIKLPLPVPPSPPPPPPIVVGRDYRLSNFWLAKEVNKELKKKFLH